jgi:hypothetical protein
MKSVYRFGGMPLLILENIESEEHGFSISATSQPTKKWEI